MPPFLHHAPPFTPARPPAHTSRLGADGRAGCGEQGRHVPGVAGPGASVARACSGGVATRADYPRAGQLHGPLRPEFPKAQSDQDAARRHGRMRLGGGPGGGRSRRQGHVRRVPPHRARANPCGPRGRAGGRVRAPDLRVRPVHDPISICGGIAGETLHARVRRPVARAPPAVPRYVRRLLLRKRGVVGRGAPGAPGAPATLSGTLVPGFVCHNFSFVFFFALFGMPV